MSGVIVPGGVGAWVRPFPGGISRPFPGTGAGTGTGTRPLPPGTTVDIGPVIGPTTQPGDIITPQTKGDATTRPQEMARDLTEDNNNKRKKDCRCEASYTCKGSVSMQNRGEAGLEYQLYIANLRSAPIAFTSDALPPKLQGPPKGGTVKNRFNVTEWRFGGVSDWDGFWVSGCTLVEAKGNYGFMRKIPRLLEFQVGKWIKGQIVKHHVAIKPYQKPKKGGSAVKAQWHFQNKEVWTSLLDKMGARELAQKKKEGLSFHHTPYETEKDRRKREEEDRKELERFYQEHPELRA